MASVQQKVEAILSAKDAGFSAVFKKAQSAVDNFEKNTGKGLESLAGKASDISSKLAKTATAGVIAFTTASINEGAKLEQSLGGVETLFKNNADAVISNARRAYKTSGVSANEYMEQVTSFSASLIGSLGGDTVKASKLADTAMVDMSDNANKFGTDISSIQNAYQGFAKQNYTMLDNLKLGYGGTKAEMERLLETANKINAENGVHTEYQVENFADIVEAIHLVQEEMEITGTTALEADETLSGSLGAMKASFQDFLGVLSTGEGDLTQTMDNVGETAKTFASNIGGMLERIATSVWELIDPFKETILLVGTGLGFVQFAPHLFKASQGFSSLTGGINTFSQNGIGSVWRFFDSTNSGINNVLGNFGGFGKALGGVNSVIAGAGQTGLNIASGTMNALTTVMQVGLKAIAPTAVLGVLLVGLGMLNEQFGEQINQFATIAIEQGPTIIQNFINGITSRIPDLIAQGVELIAVLADVIVANLPTIIQAGIDLIGSLVEGVGSNAGSLIESFVEIINVVLVGLVEALPQFILMGVDLLVSLTQGVLDNLDLILATITDVINGFISGIDNYLPQIIQQGIQVLMNLVQGIITALPVLINSAGDLITGLINGIVANLPMLLENGITLIITLVQGIIEALPVLIENAGQIMVALLQGIVQALPQLIQAGIMLPIMLIMAIIQGLPQIVEAGWELIRSLGQGILEAIPNIFKGVWEGIQNAWNGIWDWVKGKNKDESANMEAEAQASSDNIKNTTSEMSTSIQTTTSEMSSAVTTNYSEMTFNSSDLIASLSENTTSNTANARDIALSNTSLMADGVVFDYEAMQTGASNSLNSLSKDTKSDTAKAKDIALSNTNVMADGVVFDYKTMQTGASDSLNILSKDTTSNTAKAKDISLSNTSLMANGISTNYNNMANTSNQALAKLNTSTTTATNQSTQQTTASLNKLDTQYKTTYTNIEKTVTQVLKKIVEINANNNSTILNATKTGGSSYNNAVQSALNVSANKANTFSVIFTATFTKLVSTMRTLGTQAGSGFYIGLEGQTGRILAQATYIANQVEARMRKALKTHSPSRVTENIGEDTGEGLVGGMSDKVKDIKRISDAMAYSAIPNIDFSAITRTIASVNAMTASGLDYNVEQTINNTRQPIVLNVTMGERTYRGFADDINEHGEATMQFEEVYGY